jgi:hypothetical protein
VLERIARAIYAWAFSVPERKHTVMAAAREEADLLRAPDRCCGEILVESRLEANVRGLEKLTSAPELAIETAERGPAVPGNEACRVEPRGRIAALLHQEQAYECLQSREIKRVRIEPIALV